MHERTTAKHLRNNKSQYFTIQRLESVYNNDY